MNLSLTTPQQLLQYSSQSILGLLCIASVLVVAWIWFLKSQKSDTDSPKSSVSIKIDRNGKYRYEAVPNSGNSNLKFWVKIMIAIIALAFLWIPIKSILNPQY